MKKYKGLNIPELFIEEKDLHSIYDYCSNSLCRHTEIVCSKCLFNLKYNKLFREWIIMKNRENKLERIVNG
jgi:hypothetical protein